MSEFLSPAGDLFSELTAFLDSYRCKPQDKLLSLSDKYYVTHDGIIVEPMYLGDYTHFVNGYGTSDYKNWPTVQIQLSSPEGMLPYLLVARGASDVTVIKVDPGDLEPREIRDFDDFERYKVYDQAERDLVLSSVRTVFESIKFCPPQIVS